MKAIREGVLVVLPRSDELVDVFVDKGWDNHAVFKAKDGKLQQIEGPKLSVGQQNFVGRLMLGSKYQPIGASK